MATRSYPLIIKQGRSLLKPFRRRYSAGANAGEVIDFPNLSAPVTNARLQVRDTHLSEGGDLILDLSTDNGGIVLGKYTDTHGEDWSGYLNASAAVTGALTPFGIGVWDLVLWTTDETWVRTLFSGRALLVPATTDWEA